MNGVLCLAGVVVLVHLIGLLRPARAFGCRLVHMFNHQHGVMVG